MAACRAVKEFSIKGCPECCFSTGGHMAAAVNQNSITIYNVYTFEAVASLRCCCPTLNRTSVQWRTVLMGSTRAADLPLWVQLANAQPRVSRTGADHTRQQRGVQRC